MKPSPALIEGGGRKLRLGGRTRLLATEKPAYEAGELPTLVGGKGGARP
jgi:hypothetical protein